MDQDHQLVVTLASLCFLLDMRLVDALVASVWLLGRRIQVLGEVWFCQQGRPLVQLEAERFLNRVTIEQYTAIRHRLDAEGVGLGRPLPVIDGLMLATAARHDLIFVTRNVRDCAQRGVPVMDPFTGTLYGELPARP